MPTINDVNDIPPIIVYTGTAAQDTYAYPFPAFQVGDLVVIVDGVLQVIVTDYTVTGITNDFGGDIIFTVPSSGGENIIIYRDTPVDRLTDYVISGDFNAQDINNDLDRIILMIQEVRGGVSGVDRSFRIAIGDTTPAADLILPEPTGPTGRNLSIFSWDASGKAIAVKYADLLGLIGGSSVVAGDGMIETPVGATTVLDVVAGTGLTANPNDVQINAANLVILGDADSGNIGKVTSAIFTGDCNTLTESGFYNVDFSATNNPVNSNGALVTAARFNTSTTQTYTVTSTNDFYFRSQSSGVWSLWEQVVTPTNFNVVVNPDAVDVNYIDPLPLTHPYTNLQTSTEASLRAITNSFDPTGSSLLSVNVQDAIEELDLVVQGIVSGLNFRGGWDALTNTPDIANDATRANGDFWKVTVAGASSLPEYPGGGPLTAWDVGDSAIWIDDTVNDGWLEVIPTTVILASNVLFDDTNFVVDFPLVGVPPAQVQQALDFNWPILSNADEGNIGKDNAGGGQAVTDLDLLEIHGFEVYNNTTLNTPGTGNRGACITTVYDGFYRQQMAIEGTPSAEPQLFIRHFDSVSWSDWRDFGDIGSDSNSVVADFDLITKTGFYIGGAATLNTPFAGDTTLIHQARDQASAGIRNSQICVGDDRIYRREDTGGTWGDWLSNGNAGQKNIGGGVSVADLDSIDSHSFEVYNNTTANTPLAAGNRGACITTVFDGFYRQQIAIEGDPGAEPRLYIRHFDSVSWSDWHSFGNWGIGSQLQPLDADLIQFSGTYNMGASATNVPEGTSADLIHQGGLAGSATQIYLNHSSANVYTRTAIAGVWSAWDRTVTDTTVPVATGALFGGFKYTLAGGILNLITV